MPLVAVAIAALPLIAVLLAAVTRMESVLLGDPYEERRRAVIGDVYAEQVTVTPRR